MDPKVADPRYKRRCDHRYGVNLDATLQIPVDDSSSAYLKTRATIENVSIMGLQLRIRRLKKAHIPIVARVGTDCSIFCGFPDTGESAYLAGKIVWVEVSRETDPADVHLGLQLTDTVYREHYRLLRLIDRLRMAHTPLPARDHHPLESPEPSSSQSATPSP